MAATALKASRKMTRKSWQLLQQLAASPAGQATSNSNRFATLEDIDNVLTSVATMDAKSATGEAYNGVSAVTALEDVAVGTLDATAVDAIKENFLMLTTKLNTVIAAFKATVTD